jgi:hypothetical protein
VQARGYDDLPTETLDRFGETHVGAVEPPALRSALAACVVALREGVATRVPNVGIIAERLTDLR